MHASRYIAHHHDGPAQPGSYDVVTLSGAGGAARWHWWLRHEERPVTTFAMADERAGAPAMLALPPHDRDAAYSVVTLPSADEGDTAGCAAIVIQL
jgi:hypothetical protein